MNLVANLTSSELKYKIALGTPIPDLPKLCASNSQWKEVCDSEEFWKLRFRQDFPNKWRLKDKGWKESYQFWYLAKIKARPFGYYPDDQQVLDSLYRYVTGIDRNVLLKLNHDNIYLDNPDRIINDIITYGNISPPNIMLNIISNIIINVQRGISLPDIIVRNNVDQISFLSSFFKMTKFDRIH